MNITLDVIIVWLIVGALAGYLTGIIVKRRMEGFGWISNLGIGLVGAIIGGGIFRIFKIDLGLSGITVSMQDVVSALIGALVFLGGVWIGLKIQKRKKAKEE